MTGKVFLLAPDKDVCAVGCLQLSVYQCGWWRKN